MERRSHRIAILALVVLLHVPLLLAIRAGLAPATIPKDPPNELRLEFVLNEAAKAPPPMPRRAASASRSRANGSPGARRDDARDAEKPSDLGSRLRANDEVLATSSFLTTEGALRISSTLAEDIAAKPVEGPNTFHIPTGDVWVLREPKPPIEFRDTAFAQIFLPEGMNPVEEACWRNKGLAFIMTVLGSQDCADPGGKPRRPLPQMIVYGVDSGEDILRKTEEWTRWNAR